MLSTGLVCVLKCDKGHTHMIADLVAVDDPYKQGVVFLLNGSNLPAGKKGFHVHERGNLQNGCASLGGHYNPSGGVHGDLNDPNGHYGDLGNIIIREDGTCYDYIVSNKLVLANLLGRSIVLHSGVDDLGRGGNPESLKTGNSGSRLCCGVIGYA